MLATLRAPKKRERDCMKSEQATSLRLFRGKRFMFGAPVAKPQGYKAAPWTCKSVHVVLYMVVNCLDAFTHAACKREGVDIRSKVRQYHRRSLAFQLLDQGEKGIATCGILRKLAVSLWEKLPRCIWRQSQIPLFWFIGFIGSVNSMTPET